MNYEQMMLALNGLADASLHMRAPGDWFVLQHVEIKQGAVLGSVCGNGNTPMQAIADHWRQATELKTGEALIINAFDKERRRSVRWNGFMWAEYPT